MAFHYLATPYTKYPYGHERAFSDACDAAAFLAEFGMVVYCPIVHWHPIACRLHDKQWNFWMEMQRPFMEVAKSLIVVQMPGWKDSDGIALERSVFEAKGAPVRFLSWPLVTTKHFSSIGIS